MLTLAYTRMGQRLARDVYWRSTSAGQQPQQKSPSSMHDVLSARAGVILNAGTRMAILLASLASSGRSSVVLPCGGCSLQLLVLFWGFLHQSQNKTSLTMITLSY